MEFMRVLLAILLASIFAPALTGPLSPMDEWGAKLLLALIIYLMLLPLRGLGKGRDWDWRVRGTDPSGLELSWSEDADWRGVYNDAARSGHTPSPAMSYRLVHEPEPAPPPSHAPTPVFCEDVRAIAEEIGTWKTEAE